MSAYIDFYAKRKNVYIPIADFSRSNPIYQVMSDYIGWEKIIPFDEKLYNNVIKELKEKIEEYKGYIKDYEDEIDLIVKMPDTPLNEKLESINSNKRCIDDWKEEIEIIESQIIFLHYAYDMNDSYSKTEVWVGHEVGLGTLEGREEE